MASYYGDESLSQALKKAKHYPLVTRMLIDIFLCGELSSVGEIDIEPEFGYVGRIVYLSGAVGMIRGGRCHVNDEGASAISRDKGYAKYYLAQLGYRTPEGKVFVCPRNLSIEDPLAPQNQEFIAEIDSYIGKNIGYPCYFKPNAQSQGDGVYKCLDTEDLVFALSEDLRERLLASSYASFQLLMVEEAIPWPEYRVVVFRDEVVACYRRRPLEVKGNGQATIEELLRRKQKKFSQSARAKRFNIHDPRIARRLRKEQKDFATILPAGERYTVHDISNSSAGGEIEDYTERIHPYWSALCIQVVADMGLRLCGVDLACPDLESIGANYSILELNAAPGLSNYVAMGAVQKKRVREMYGKIFSEEFDVPTARLSPTIGRWKEIAADDLS